MEIERKNPLVDSSPESPYLWQVSISDKKIKTLKSSFSKIQSLLKSSVSQRLVLIKSKNKLNTFTLQEGRIRPQS